MSTASEVILYVLKDFAKTLEEEGECTEKYKFSFSCRSTDRFRVAQTLTISGTSDEFTGDFALTKEGTHGTLWTNKGTKSLVLKRFSTEEERFQESLVSDQVFSTEHEVALIELMKRIMAYMEYDLVNYTDLHNVLYKS